MNGKLDILFVNPDSRRSAGCNVSLLGVISGLDKTRFRTHMAVPADNEYQDALEQLGVQVVDYRSNNWWYPTSRHFHRHLAGWRERVMALVSVIRDQEIDLVYTNAEYAFEGALAAAIAGVPHVWAQRVLFTADLDVLEHFHLSETGLAQLMADLSDMVVPNSGAGLRSFPASFPSHKLQMIESGLNIQHSLPPGPNQKKRSPPWQASLTPAKSCSQSVTSARRKISPLSSALRLVCWNNPRTQTFILCMSGMSLTRHV